jgi:hypothetical protein
MSKVRGGMKRYKDTAISICCFGKKDLDNFEEMEIVDRDAFLGVCMVLAFMDGVGASLFDFSKHLGFGRNLLEEPFNRLKVNNVFSFEYNAKNDKVLLGFDKKETEYVSSNHRSEIAWGILAGTASGHTGIRNDKDIKRLSI